MGGSSSKQKSRPKDKVKADKPKGKAKARKSKGKSKAGGSPSQKQKINSKAFAIALIFVMLFVSYVVIFSSQNDPPSSKNMVFNLEEEDGTRSGYVEGISILLSDINMTIKDSSSGSTIGTDVFEHGVVVETFGGFNCTFLDKNSNGMLDEGDDFIVYNAYPGDLVELFQKSTDEKVAFYTF